MLAGRYKCQFVSGVYFEDMANVYANARVVFNRSAHGDLNMRVFEAMCSGRPLVTDTITGAGFEELLGSAWWCVADYQNDDEMFGAIDDFISWPESRSADASGGGAMRRASSLPAGVRK